MNSKVKRSPHDAVEGSMKRARETVISSLWSFVILHYEASADGSNGWDAAIIDSKFSVKSMHHFTYINTKSRVKHEDCCPFAVCCPRRRDDRLSSFHRWEDERHPQSSRSRMHMSLQFRNKHHSEPRLPNIVQCRSGVQHQHHSHRWNASLRGRIQRCC